LVDGSFENGISKWIPEGMSEKQVKGNFYAFELISRVDEVFKKTDGSKSTSVLQYKNNQSWTNVAQYVTLKPDTNYIFKGQAIHLINEEEAKSGFSIQAFNDVSAKYLSLQKNVDANNVTTAIFTTPSDLRKEGDNIKLFLSMPGITNMGYWGFVEIYELDETGNPIGNNVIINGDFACGLAGWEVNGNVDLRVGRIDFDDFCLAELPNTPNIKKTAENDESQANWINAEKFLLYNDCFMGKFDCVVTKGLGKRYKDVAEKLNKLSKDNDYSTVFATLSALCNVLELKAEIGVRTRKAYTEKDTVALKNIIKDYDEILVRLDSFYEAFKKQWDKENKPQGFEVQDARIGGLSKRISHCKERLEQYINGEIDIIEELNEKMLDYRPGDEKNIRNDILFNSYCSTVSSGNM